MAPDELQVQSSHAYTDEEWDEWKDYADVVTIKVRCATGGRGLR